MHIKGLVVVLRKILKLAHFSSHRKGFSSVAYIAYLANCFQVTINVPGASNFVLLPTRSCFKI